MGCQYVVPAGFRDYPVKDRLTGTLSIHFWRDKQQREADFVVPRGRSACDAVECKWSLDSFAARGLKAFRQNYPHGRNVVISPQVVRPYTQRIEELEVTFMPLEDLGPLLLRSSARKPAG